MTKRKIAIGMSGGVDSTIAAHMLKEAGHCVVGITMQIWDGPPAKTPQKKTGCYSSAEIYELEHVKEIAQQLGIEHVAVNLQKEYRNIVLEYVCNSYLKGETPNPCVLCNRKIKFGALLDKAREMGLDFDYFATGHYARIENVSGRYLLKTGLDISKDQSYFLWGLTQSQLAKMIFPLGSCKKTEIKALAKKLGLKEVAEQAESQDFIAEENYSMIFPKNRIPSGNIKDINGNTVGKHKGIVHYTIGQRKGLGIGGMKTPWYVIGINADKNEIVVGHKEKLFSKEFFICQGNWIAFEVPPAKVSAFVKIRQQNKPAKAVIIPLENGRAKVVFDEAQASVTAGQSAVFYEGDTVLGGGIIESIEQKRAE